eukprot:1186060-Pyramimonas_sp.AAC.1
MQHQAEPSVRRREDEEDEARRGHVDGTELGRLAGPLRPYVVTAQELDPECSKMLRYLSWETEKVVKPSVDLRAHGLTQEDAARLRREAARFCIGED